MNEGLYDAIEIRKAIEQIHPSGELFEIRIIGNRGPISGYFRDADTLLEKFKTVDLRNTNVYITVNQINDDLFSRQQSETFIKGANSTHDHEVDGYKWLFIDLDPVRAAGISSKDDELKMAYALARRVDKYLSDLGFCEPVKAVSGNGAHLLYRISLRNTEENAALIEKCLKALSMLFDTDEVKVDTTNFNPSRVCKLYGTMAQKGKNTQSRPHRMSKLIGDIKQCQITDKVYLEKLAAELPQEEIKPSRYNNYNPSEFDIEEWMNNYGLSYRKANYKDGVKYVLDECPFDPSHKAPDSMITRASSGAIGFKCLHNSCSHYHWQDLRIKFEPDAYDRNEGDKRIEEGWAQHNRDKAETVEIEKPKEPMFLTASMIYDIQEPEEEYIKTGINELDKRMHGLAKKKLSLVSGLRGAAKSTVLSQIILNCIENDKTSVVYSGELPKKGFMKWMYLQAAGKGYTEKYRNFDGYFCPENIKPSINDWMSDRLWLYNNDYGNNFNRIASILSAKIEEVSADICIVDNLMALDLSDLDRDKYEAQTLFMWKLKEIAEKMNCHVIVVAHPRKAQGFLRLDDVAGSGNIGNIVDNAFIIHRNNEDFKRMTKQMFAWKESHDAYSGTNVIEVCKDRDGGLQDYFIPLWYEPNTKRLKNVESENIVYSWKKPVEDPRWQDADDDEIPY